MDEAVLRTSVKRAVFRTEYETGNTFQVADAATLNHRLPTEKYIQDQAKLEEKPIIQQLHMASGTRS